MRKKLNGICEVKWLFAIFELWCIFCVMSFYYLWNRKWLLDPNFFHQFLGHAAHATLPDLTDSLKDCFLDMVAEIPDGSKWVTLSNRDIKILRNLTIYHDDILSSNDYIAVACFKVQAKPISVFNFLIKKNMELQVYFNFYIPDLLLFMYSNY